MRIIFVGIHNKPETLPLDSSTKSGKLIDKIIFNLPEHTCIKTNLFDLNYIPQEDVDKHSQKWIEKYYPTNKDVIILLGSNVHKLFPKNVQSILIEVKHPSSIWSKRAQEEYVKYILNKLTNF